MATRSNHASTKILLSAESYQEYEAARSLLEEMACQNSNWGNPPNWGNLNITEWQVGITADSDRLLEEDGVSKENAVLVRAGSHEMARRIKRRFLAAGAQGDPEGGDEGSVIVYAYHR